MEFKAVALPQAGETWRKWSFPFPTVVQVVGRHGDGTLTVKYGRRRVTLNVEQFIGQGFERIEEP